MLQEPCVAVAARAIVIAGGVPVPDGRERGRVRRPLHPRSRVAASRGVAALPWIPPVPIPEPGRTVGAEERRHVGLDLLDVQPQQPHPPSSFIVAQTAALLT